MAVQNGCVLYRTVSDRALSATKAWQLERLHSGAQSLCTIRQECVQDIHHIAPLCVFLRFSTFLCVSLCSSRPLPKTVQNPRLHLASLDVLATFTMRSSAEDFRTHQRNARAIQNNFRPFWKTRSILQMQKDTHKTHHRQWKCGGLV